VKSTRTELLHNRKSLKEIERPGQDGITDDSFGPFQLASA
jgi:hypothetical protein